MNGFNPIDFLGNTLGSVAGSLVGGIKQGFGFGGTGIGQGGGVQPFAMQNLGINQETFDNLPIGDKLQIMKTYGEVGDWNQGNPMQWISSLGNLGLGLAQYKRAGDIFDFQKDAWSADQNAARTAYNTNRRDQLRSRWSSGDPRNVDEQYEKDALKYV